MAGRLKLYACTHDILGDVFWDVFRNGLFEAAARYEVDVEHLRPGRFSPEIMAAQLEGAVAARPDGLISTIPDPAAVDGSLHKAAAAGIPVVVVNTQDPRAPGERPPRLVYIGGEDVAAGGLAAGYLLGRVRPRAAVCVDHYLHEHVCHHDRWLGFERAMREAGVPAERLRVPGGDAAACAAKVAEYVGGHQECGGVLTLGPPGAQAVLDAGGREVPHVTFDVARLQIEGIRSGRILATVDSQQWLQGYLAVEVLWLHLRRGLTPASDVLTGPSILEASGVERAAEGVMKGWR